MKRKTTQKRKIRFWMHKLGYILIMAAVIAAGRYIYTALEENDPAIDSVFVADTQQEAIELEAVTLDQVVDGDTLWIIDQSGNRSKIRLIGIDTPESVHPDVSSNNEYGQMASDYTKYLLADQTTVYLQYDQEREDQYERTLAYVWLSDDVDVSSDQDVRNHMLNAILVADGYAYDKVYEPNHAYADRFRQLRMEAEEQTVGLWQYQGFKDLW